MSDIKDRLDRLIESRPKRPTQIILGQREYDDLKWAMREASAEPLALDWRPTDYRGIPIALRTVEHRLGVFWPDD